MGMKVEEMGPNISTNGRKNSNMKLIQVILSQENLNEAIKRVKSNNGAAGVDKMTVYEIDECLNEGYESVIDLDMEAYFDTVNHDKLISILRENVNDLTMLHFIIKYILAGIVKKGLVKPNTIGMPQGRPL